MNLRPVLTPPPLDTALVDRLTLLAEEIARNAEEGRATKDAIARFNADAGTRFGLKDIHGAAGAAGMRAFVERALTHASIVLDLTDPEAATLVRRIRAGDGTPREQFYWRRVLEKSLGQPGMDDLLDYPNQELSAETVVVIARTCFGSSLARYLDPVCAGYHVARGLLRTLTKQRLIALRPGASVDQLARGAGQFLGRSRLTKKQVTDLAAWLVAQPAVEELFADDERLADLLTTE